MGVSRQFGWGLAPRRGGGRRRTARRLLATAGLAAALALTCDPAGAQLRQGEVRHVDGGQGVPIDPDELNIFDLFTPDPTTSTDPEAEEAEDAEQGEPEQEPADAEDAPEEDEGGVGFVALPVPIANPTIGVGLGAAVALLYRLDPESNTSSTGVGAFYTDSTSRGVGAQQQLSAFGDSLRAEITGGLASLSYDFFGVGSSAGGSGRSVPITQEGVIFVAKGWVRTFDSFFVGFQYRGLDTQTVININQPRPPSIPNPQLDVVTSGVGPLLEYDSRNNEFQPSAGTFFEFQSFIAREDLGGDFNYERAFADINRYQALGEGLVLAGRLYGCGAGGEVPFFDLCLFGAGPDLRGYPAGRYRDRAMLAGQVEARWSFTDRWGVVGFAGVGAVGDRFSDLGPALPSLGAGIRWEASQKFNLNIGVDYAVGRDSDAFYFRIGEAF